MAENPVSPRISVTSYTAETWRDVAGIDPRGYQWGHPGLFVVVTNEDTGTQLAEIKINYVHMPDASDGRPSAIAALTDALATLYEVA
jgi:hypothetical protein